MYDFIAVGDTATDVFIKLGENSRAKIEGVPDTLDYRLTLPFAEKIPYEDAITVAGVGNAPNAAVAAAILGLRSALVARIGADAPGQETLKVLAERKVDTKFVITEEGKHTNYSYVLWYKQDRTLLRRKEEFVYTLPDLGSPSWLYLSSIGSSIETFYDELLSYLEKNPQVNLVFQPGSKEIELGLKLEKLYKRTKIYFSNVEEAGKILGIETLGIEELLKRVKALGPEIVIITDGPKGAYAYDGENIYQQLPFPDPKPPLERTGAGDAFASTTVVALALGKTLPEALQWGAINSMSVVQEVGAQKGLLSRDKIEEYLKSAPVDFQTKKLG